MKNLRCAFTQSLSFGQDLTRRPPGSVYGQGFLCALVLSVAAQVSFAQAPGWSRGQQLLAITYDDCVRRAPQALQAEGYRMDYASGNFAVGIKDVHTAVIICSPAPDAKMLVHIVVASNGEGGGAERQRLQAQMERPGAVTRGGDNSFTTWTWAYAPPGQQPEVHGTVKIHANGNLESDNNSGTWTRSGNRIIMRWKNGVDTLTLSSDGKVMTGTNNSGWNIRGTLQQ